MRSLKLCLCVVAVAFSVTLDGCSFFQSPKGVATEAAGVDIAKCVLGELAKGDENPETIAAVCAATAVDDVVKIVEAYKATEKARAMKAPSAGQ